MTTSTPSSVTAEEAVAYMVNADAIPECHSLIDMLSLSTEDAEHEYEKAKTDGLPEEIFESLQTALKICRARQALACYLLQAIENEQCSDEESILKPLHERMPAIIAPAHYDLGSIRELPTRLRSWATPIQLHPHSW